MEVSAEDEAVYNTVNDNLLTSLPMTVQDIAKEVLDNKAAKDLEDDIPEKEEEVKEEVEEEEEEEEEEEVEKEGGAGPCPHSTAHYPAHAEGLHHCTCHEGCLVLLHIRHF